MADDYDADLDDEIWDSEIDDEDDEQQKKENEEYERKRASLPAYVEGMIVRCPLESVRFDLRDFRHRPSIFDKGTLDETCADGAEDDEDDEKFEACDSEEVIWCGDGYTCLECREEFDDAEANPPHRREHDLNLWEEEESTYDRRPALSPRKSDVPRVDMPLGTSQIRCRGCDTPYDSANAHVTKKHGPFCSRDCAAAKINEVKRGAEERLYDIWRSMRRRCGNPNDSNWDNYGGNGVKVCETWESNYFEFRDWAVTSGYDPKLEIDRRDSDRGYNPENCRWATGSQQSANTRKRKTAKLSKYKGSTPVRNSKSGKWTASICSGGKRKYLGTFSSEEDAARAYDRAAIEQFGEFACLNFPRSEYESSTPVVPDRIELISDDD